MASWVSRLLHRRCHNPVTYHLLPLAASLYGQLWSRLDTVTRVKQTHCSTVNAQHLGQVHCIPPSLTNTNYVFTVSKISGCLSVRCAGFDLPDIPLEANPFLHRWGCSVWYSWTSAGDYCHCVSYFTLNNWNFTRCTGIVNSESLKNYKNNFTWLVMYCKVCLF